MRHKYRKRNFLDVIVTDSRPVELPLVYSTSFYYDYLCERNDVKDMFEYLKNESMAFDRIQEGGSWGASWHSTPLKYHIYKNRFELREMSLISPLSMLEMALFVGIFEKQLIIMTSNEGFSIRKHQESDKISYVSMLEGHGIKYKQDNEDDIIEKVEASGLFFKLLPYKILSDFHKSEEWYRLNREYLYFGKIDYSKCFDSIYTHTFSRIITKSIVDNRHYGECQYVLNLCDKFLQNINASQTSGIVVGPECSRLLVEIILQEVDNRVKDQLLLEGLIEEDNYAVKRYVDDIYIFADSEKSIERIIQLYAIESERFRLHLNDKKQNVGKLPTVWFGWKDKIHPVKEYIISGIFTDKDKFFAVECRGKMIATMKMLYQDLMALYVDEQKRVASYLLSTIRTKLFDEKRPLFDYKNYVNHLYHFMDLVFYIYSFSMTYTNTDRLICILYRVKKDIPDIIFCEALSKVIKNYASSIIKANTEDVVNLLLLIGLYDIELPYSIESKLLGSIEEKENPILYAVALFCIKSANEKKNLQRMIEERIENAISNIYDRKQFFLYDEAWWIYIFAKCPLLKKKTISMMDDLLDNLMDLIKNDQKKSACAKRIVIEFLRDDEYCFKFINWDLTKETLFERVDFKTYNRMLVNGYKVKNDKYDVDEDY